MNYNHFRPFRGFMTIIMLWMFFFRSFSQDPVLSQFYNAHLLMNAAMSGQTHAPMIQLNYRNQWPSLNQIYNTYSLSYDQYFHKIKSGLGFNLIADNAGDGTLRNTAMTIFYSYKIKVKGETYVKGGIEAGYANMSLNWDRLVFGDAINSRFGNVGTSAEIPFNVLSQNYLNIGTGMVLSSPYYYVGVSLKNLNSPSLQFLTLGDANVIPTRLSLHAGTQIILSRGNKNTLPSLISPNIIFQRQGGYNQLNASCFLEANQFLGGLGYRHSVFNGDAAIFSFGFRQNFLKLTYSFDYTTSQLGIRQGGSHEVSMVLNFDYLYPKKQDYNDCFSIFR